MYKLAEQQMSIYDYIPPFEGRLESSNRWIRLSAMVDWDALEREYSRHFCRGGKTAITARAAFGSLVIHDALHLSDAETVQQIRENPYLQYFIGQKNFEYECSISVRSMARFRKRIPAGVVAEVAALFAKLQKSQKKSENAPDMLDK